MRGESFVGASCKVPSAGVVTPGPRPIQVFVLVGFEGFTDVGFMGGKPILWGGPRGKSGAADECFHHGELNPPDPLQAFPREVPGFTGPEEGLGRRSF